MKRSNPLIAALFSAFGAAGVHAVYQNPDGHGQALIYPYYTTREAPGGALNTYLSVSNNQQFESKAIRVRFLEGRGGRVIASFNLFLGPYDMWTGAVVPTPEGAKLITADRSCATGFTPSDGFSELAFSNASFSGSASDNAGTGLDRTREGYVEMIEMATLTGTSAASVTLSPASGFPANCAAVTSPGAVVSTGNPSGQLSGTLTLINVANGMDFMVNAVALADLSTRPFFRPAEDPYPDFSSAEVTPENIAMHAGQVWRSRWNNGVDAVAAALSRARNYGEIVLDAETRSRTDIVYTLPMRRLKSVPAGYGHYGSIFLLSRSGVHGANGAGCPDHGALNCDRHTLRWSANVAPIYRFGDHARATTGSSILGSTQVTRQQPNVPTADEPASANGWVSHHSDDAIGANDLTSRDDSTRWDLATGQVTAGFHRYAGLSTVGFSLRTFENGQLACPGAATCQGNYGGVFPLSAEPAIFSTPLR